MGLYFLLNNVKNIKRALKTSVRCKKYSIIIFEEGED